MKSDRGRAQNAVAEVEVQSASGSAIKGAFWMTLQSLGTRVVAIAAQFVLTRLLTREDFALWALIGSTVALGQQLATSGINKVLVQRGSELGRWANVAFWISLVLGSCLTVLLAAFAPLLSSAFGDARLVPLLLIVAPSILLRSLSSVPAAMLEAQLRFRELAAIRFSVAFGAAVLSVVIAIAGGGAYAFALPVPILAAVGGLWMWRKGRPEITLDPEWRRWRRMGHDSALTVATSLVAYAAFNGDYLMLGYIYRHDLQVLGLYYFAYTFASQSVTLIARNIASALLPIMVGMNADPKRQVAAFVRSSRALALIGIPIATLQAVVADPAIRLLFDEKWHSAIPVFRILSMAMALRVVGTPASQLMLAQGRYRPRLVFEASATSIFLLIVAYGAYEGGAVGTAQGVLASYSIQYILGYGVVLRICGGRMRELWGVVVFPMLFAVIVGSVATFAMGFIDDERLFARLLVGGISTALLFVVVSRIFFFDIVLDLYRAVLRASKR